tara:strand:- start:809 stop:1024 length:216 start_codon:yes stop_codon:yes gene_type:complete
MSDRKIPHKAIVGMNVYVYEEAPDGTLRPGAKYRKNFTLMTEGFSKQDCVEKVLTNIKETQSLWIKNSKTS